MNIIKYLIFATTFFKMSLSKHFLKLFLGVYFFLSGICYGQQYPVQVNVVILPPYAMRLGEYATTGEEKMRVQLLMTDLQEPMHQVKLRFTLEAGSNSVVMGGSTPFVSGWNNVTLMPGMPVWLSNIDMRALFDYNNLTGISYIQYSKPLPQGIYRYCFQALDAFNNRELSAKSCAMVYLQQYDPPMLNLPQRAEKVMKQGAFQNILFQWMPRQLAPSTKYIFTLKEIWDRSIDAQMAFLTSRTLYEETVLPNMLYYGMDKPWLMAGKRYAWQVKAISANPALPNSSLPTDEDGVYRNNGLSEIYWFDYEENCNVPQFLTAKVVGRGRAEIRWSAPQSTTVSNNTYKLQYRKKGGGVWTEQQTTQEIVNLTDLGDGIDYEYRVGSVCGSSGDEGYVYSGIQTFTLPTKEEQQQQYQCGVMPKIEIANQEPMKGTMAVNEVFTAGDFAVTVLSSEGADGIYSGQGYVQVPYLGDTKLKVVFKEIRINTDKQLIGGMVETTYDPKERNYQFVQEGIGETFGDMGMKVMTVDYAITDIKYDSATKRLTVVGKAGDNGETPAAETLPTGRDYQLVDKDGKVWNVDENGKVSEGGEIAKGGAPNSKNTEGISGTGNNAQIEQYKVKNIKLSWEKDANTKYAFDDGSNKPKELQKEYTTIKDAEGKEVIIPYKAVVNGKEDVLNAVIEITDTALNSAEVIFKTLNTGKAIPIIQQYKTPNGRKYTLQLKGAYDYATEEVMAMLVPKDSGAKQQVIGSFKLVHLSPKRVNITLVPLDAQAQQKIQSYKEELQKIYDSIGITFNIKEEPVMDISRIVQGNEIVSEDAETMSTYSQQQQQINAMYKGQSNDRYVVFITSKRASTGQGGYMRLNGQFGYVYGNAEAKTLAHEIGHGVFRLEHPWSKYKTTKNSSNLLLDYKAGGRELSHIDWKQINDPAFKLYAFQSQSEGEAYNKNAHFCLSPSGTIIDKFYINRQLVNPTYVVSNNTTGVLDMIQYQNKYYRWNKSINVYTEDNGTATIKGEKDATKTNTNVNLFRYGDNCIYYSTVISWTAEDEKSQDIANTIKKKLQSKKETDWEVSAFDIRDVSCNNNFIQDLHAKDKEDCSLERIAEGKQRLQNALNVTKGEKVVYEVNSVCLSAIKNLPYQDIAKLLNTITTQSSLDNLSELSVLRLMNGIQSKDYPAFYKLLETDNNKMLCYLVDKMNDASIWFWTEEKNSTNFIGALVTMFSTAPASIADRLPKTDDDCLKRTLNLNPIVYDKGTFLGGIDKYNKGSYDANTGIVTIRDVYATYMLGGGEMPSKVERKIEVEKVSPLTPIIVVPEKDKIGLVSAVLDGAKLSNGSYLVPAIFLKYNDDKVRVELIQQQVMKALDMATIATGAGTLWKGVLLARKIWAVAEIAGAVGNIGVNEQAITNAEVKAVVDIYNGAMGIIGIKNLAQGMVSFGKTLPDATKNLLKQNQGIKSLFVAKYLDWQAATAKLTKISDAERKLINEQEQVWKMLGVADDVGKVAGKIVNNVDEIKELLKTENSKAFFWSGRTANGESVMDIASDIAQNKGGTTLENILKRYKIIMPEWDENNPAVVKLWEDVSASYANQVSGEVRAVIGKNLRIGNIWETIELPRLKKNPNVTKIYTIDSETKIEILLWKQ